MALVTGGAVRIGRAICEALAARGCGVVVHYDRSEREAAKLVASLRKKGAEAFSVRMRFGGEKECGRLMDVAWRKAGNIDFLINNAAVFHKDSLSSTTEKKMMAELQVNFLAPVWLTKEFAKRINSRHATCAPSRRVDVQGGMACRRPSFQHLSFHPNQASLSLSGKVVNILDQRIVGISTDCVPYLLSKKMLSEFTRMAALELAPSVTVNGVAPGPALPVDKRLKLAASEEAGDIPLVRRPTPADVAAAVVFLLESDSITGQTVFVDGGQHLK